MKNYHGWVVNAERSGRIVENNSYVPDIIVEVNGICVIIETEYDSSNTLEKDVNSRIGCTIRGIGTPQAILGVYMPQKLKKYTDEKLEMSIKTESIFKYYIKWNLKNRFPTKGYLEGTLADICAAITLTTIPEDRIKKCVQIMKQGIEKIAHCIDNTDYIIKRNISLCVMQEPSDQTWNMAGLILLNAGVFYEELAKYLEKIDPMSTLSILGIISQEKMVDAWKRVLKVNYAPIFSDAVDILTFLPADTASDIISTIKETVSTVISLKIAKSGDVYGQLYQDMIIDRKKIASFYTLPEAAALLTGLVMPSSMNAIWSDINKIKNLRIADFTCGTGMLLTHAYHHMRHSSKSDLTKHHKHIMENVFYGYDIMPTATHLTVSNLAGMVPDTVFDMSNIYTMPIGIHDGVTYLGSLDLIKERARFTFAGIRHGGSQSKEITITTVGEHSCDYIIMNPPYSGATKHESDRTEPITQFAIFGINEDEQKEMSKLKKKLFLNTVSHGNAGPPTDFMAIADKKIKFGTGVIGFILPSTMQSGSSWQKMRKLLAEYYGDITIVLGVPLSADTSINEIILTARKREMKVESGTERRLKVVKITDPPKNRLESVEIAKKIKQTNATEIEIGWGGMPILLGKKVVGNVFNCPINGSEWLIPKTENSKLLPLVHSMMNGKHKISMVKLSEIAVMGFLHRDIADSNDPNGLKPRAPFVMTNSAMPNSGVPCLWANDNQTQQTIIVSPDSSLNMKPHADLGKASRIKNSATHIHINNNAGYGSQRLIVAYTRKKTVGGRAWPNVILNDQKYEKIFAMWGNSVFGIMTYFISSGSQQPGRGIMSLNLLRNLPVLNFNKLTDNQIEQMDRLFDTVSTKQLLPLNQLHKDDVRKQIDAALMKILDFKIDLESLYSELSTDTHMNPKLKQ